MAVEAVNIVVEQLISMNMLTVSMRSKTAELADDETLDAAHALWYVLLQQKVSTQIAHALDTRGLLPVTIRTLAALLHDAISPLYKQD